MRTTVVPAQITTVEDRIAGNLTFVQILLLIAAMLIGASLYRVVSPRLHFNPLKLTLISLQFIFLSVLALRIQGKIVADWLILLLRFNARPRMYVFTKNDTTTRDIVVEEPKKAIKPVAIERKPLVSIPSLSLLELDQVDTLLENPSLTVRFALAKKGGIDVSFTPVKN